MIIKNRIIKNKYNRTIKRFLKDSFCIHPKLGEYYSSNNHPPKYCNLCYIIKRFARQLLCRHRASFRWPGDINMCPLCLKKNIGPVVKKLIKL